MVVERFFVNGSVNIEEFSYQVVHPRYDLMSKNEKDFIEKNNLIPTKGADKLEEIKILQPGCGILGPTWEGIFVIPTGIFVKYDISKKVDKGVLITDGGYDILGDYDTPEYKVYWVYPENFFLWVSRSGCSFLQFSRELWGILISGLKEREFSFFGKVSIEGLRMLLSLKSVKINSVSIIKETISIEEKELEKEIIEEAKKIAREPLPLDEFEKVFKDK
jgi:hypothetical protein